MLAHAGKISHQMALDKSALEYEQFKDQQKHREHEASLQELEQDLKSLKPTDREE